MPGTPILSSPPAIPYDGARTIHNDVVWFPDWPDERRFGPRQFRLKRPYGYEWEAEGRLQKLIVPACFEYDGASVPRAVWSYFPPQPLDLSAVFHDWLYRFQGDVPGDSYLVWNPFTRQWAPGRDFGMTWSRRSSDRLFARHLRETPAEWRPSRWERRAAYLAVRAGGPIAWHSATFDLKIKQ